MKTAEIRRSKYEIMAEIVQCCKRSNVIKTHILYKCNLSTDMFEDALTHLISHGLVIKNEKAGERTTYRTTEKGMQYSEHLMKALELAGCHDALRRAIDAQESYYPFQDRNSEPKA